MNKKLKTILKILILALTMIAISLSVYIFLKKFNITNIATLRKFINKFGVWSGVIFVLIQVLISTPIFIIPFEDEFWVTLSILLFGAKLGFMLSAIAMLFTSLLLYFIGNKLGYKIAKKIVSEKDLIEVQQKFNVKNKMALPFMYMIPLFPHDTLCIIAGISKMNVWYFSIVTLVMRSLEIFGLCFLGGELIPWSSFTKFDWVIIINLLIVDFYLMTKLSKYMENKIDKKWLHKFFDVFDNSTHEISGCWLNSIFVNI